MKTNFEKAVEQRLESAAHIKALRDRRQALSVEVGRLEKWITEEAVPFETTIDEYNRNVANYHARLDELEDLQKQITSLISEYNGGK